jgi:maltooligosyltrehalose trehalohydrolase
MVNFIQNHDQVANSARGLRVDKLSAPGVLKAITTLTLLGPGTPMLLQGQEFGASTPFLYFADHNKDLAEQVRQGRIDFLKQWKGLKLPEMKACFADPKLRRTFERCILDHSEADTHRETYALHRNLLRLRREDEVISAQGDYGLDGAVLGPQCLVLRFFSQDHSEDRLLTVNLGVDLEFNPSPEPLLAPPANKRWTKLFSTEDPQYGGCGTAPLDTSENWSIPGQAAVVLRPEAAPASEAKASPTH